MKILHDFFCGAVVGIANIIPGVSGGTMAVVLGVYQQLLEAISLKKLKKNIPFLLPFGVGCGLGILAFSRTIEFLLATYPMATNFVFIGLILGSIPMIWSKNKEQSRKNPLWLSGAAFVLMLALLLLLNASTGGNPDIITEMNGGIALYLAAVGAICSFCMILPGISGSFVMLLLGVYPTFLAAISHLDFLILLPIVCGMGIGLLAGCRLVSWLLEQFPQPTYCGIMGLIIGSLPGIYPGFAFNMEGAAAVVLLCAAAAFTIWFSNRGE